MLGDTQIKSFQLLKSNILGSVNAISIVSSSAKCVKIVGGCGFAPDPTGGACSAPQTLYLH